MPLEVRTWVRDADMTSGGADMTPPRTGGGGGCPEEFRCPKVFGWGSSEVADRVWRVCGHGRWSCGHGWWMASGGAGMASEVRTWPLETWPLEVRTWTLEAQTWPPEARTWPLET
jgi:hypothetical protein